MEVELDASGTRERQSMNQLKHDLRAEKQTLIDMIQKRPPTLDDMDAVADCFEAMAGQSRRIARIQRLIIETQEPCPQCAIEIKVRKQAGMFPEFVCIMCGKEHKV